ncbi:MAG: carbohydrate ABC transporter permease [Nocardioides sp.]|uniref:carbohydrate ABC transporter permease n=1 Tax=Nocardioides sp. TaxID=35761 RepID=UPI0039E5C388
MTRRVLAFLGGTLWLIIALAPFDYMVVAALRTQNGYFTENPWLPTGELTLANVGDVVDSGLGRYVLNSVVVTVAGIVLTLALALAFAYHVVKHRTRAGSLLFRMIVVGLAIPVQAIVVPLFVVVTKIHLYDSLIGLILVMAASAMPLTVVVVANFVRDIPDELIAAMRIDGAGNWTILFRLVAPMTTGALGIVAVFNGLAMWNNFLIPLLFTQSESKALLPLGLYNFQSEHGVDVPAVMTMVVLSSLPLILLFLGTRKYAMQALGGMATMR